MIATIDAWLAEHAPWTFKKWISGVLHGTLTFVAWLPGIFLKHGPLGWPAVIGIVVGVGLGGFVLFQYLKRELWPFDFWFPKGQFFDPKIDTEDSVFDAWFPFLTSLVGLGWLVSP